MPVIHLVLFQFKPSASDEAIRDICQRMLALQEQCLHPTTGLPYIKQAGGGRDISVDGPHIASYTHAFVMEFEHDKDLRYYLDEDPVHVGFANSLNEHVESVQALDFVPGIFQ